jgi:DNA repair protein RecN (Recombination protein N)
MLANLTVENIVLIDRLGIEFGPGLTVLTGETGAGKSILLDALSLALGARGDATLVRAGAERGQVSALFEPPAGHACERLLAENAIGAEGTVILRRVQMADGKTRAFINDQPCSAALLHEVGSTLVELHGQHDERALVRAEEHRRLLDAFGRLEADAQETATRFRALRLAEEEAEALRGKLADAAREADYLRAAITELEGLSPEPGEEERLAERRQFLIRAQKMAGDLGEALETIGGAASPIPALAGLARRLDRKAADVPGLLDAPLAALNAALDRLEDARGGLAEAVRACDFDAHELERTEERLFALRGAGRKYRVTVADLPAAAAEFSARLVDIDHGGERLAFLDRAAAEARTRYAGAAAALSARRAETAAALEAAVNAELPALKLEAARFMVAMAVDAARVSPDGYDNIAFHVRTNPGTAPGPLGRIASGGELSRFLLALKVALADRGSAPTLIFDEVDAGAGGAVAEAIGKRLVRLADRVQVLSVTHAPQVAAQADAHFLITKAKADRGRRAVTKVEPIEERARREEIARMLAGATVSDEARAAAERLIKGAA